ncbi:MAG: PA2169 family four-helix-bundle protein [Pyrinomonadaceae bacterium]|nr:PA2169 family four-helix-bundle protein [Pyrinomonadaceae bacterium]
MTKNEIISSLNNLIETCKDGQEGFRQASEGVEDSDLKSIFSEYSLQRAQMAGELQQIVSGLGGEPEDSSSLAGSIHRGWINIKSAVTGNDREAILNEAERGEDVAVSNYKDSLEMNFPDNIMETVRQQYTKVQAAHDRVKSLRDRSRAASA